MEELLKRLIVGAVLFGVAFADSARAQTVKQGDASSVPADPTAFHSPMVVETAFAAGDRSLWKSGKDFSLPDWWDLGKVSRDGVFIRMDPDRKRRWDAGLEMRVKELPNHVLQVSLRIGVLNPKHNQDKMVDLLLEVVNEDQTIASQRITIKAKDNGEGHQEDTKWSFPAADLRPATKLRITMTTRNY